MSFQGLISDLRKAESQLVRQLGGIRNAISSLELGGAVSPAIPRRGRQIARKATKPARKRRGMPAAARKAVGLRMRRYWARGGRPALDATVQSSPCINAEETTGLGPSQTAYYQKGPTDRRCEHPTPHSSAGAVGSPSRSTPGNRRLHR